MRKAVLARLFYQFSLLFIVLLSVISCLVFEALWQKLSKKTITIFDGSAIVTGMLLAMNLPATIPFWMVILGAFVSIIIAKQFFGGLGNNFMNPALVGRAFLLASFLPAMTKWAAPVSSPFTWLSTVDAVTCATPLAIIKGEVSAPLPSLFSVFWGNIGGCIGETSAFMIILGGIYLIYKKIITWHIPLTYILTVFVLSYILSPRGFLVGDGLYSIFCGGLMLGAFFMATDYVTSPISKKGQIVMGLGCGILTVIIRNYGGYPEGVSYSILLMNVFTPIIDKYTAPRPYGGVK